MLANFGELRVFFGVERQIHKAYNSILQLRQSLPRVYYSYQVMEQAEHQTMPMFNLLNKRTGYSVYKNDAKRRTKQNVFSDLYPKLPDEKFDVIYADPPWDYNGKLQFDKSSTDAEDINLSKKIFISSAAFKYPTLKTNELMKFPVQKIANDDCILFCGHQILTYFRP